MPTDINVADGKLANWHRFDVKDKAVVKDRSVLMSVADSTTNAREQLEAIWTKLGGEHTPPQVLSFNREDLGLNTASAVPTKPPVPTSNTVLATSITINIANAVNYAGGAPVTSVTVKATPTAGGADVTTVTSISYPYPSTAIVTGLTTATNYNVFYRFSNTFGDGPYSTPSVTIGTL